MIDILLKKNYIKAIMITLVLICTNNVIAETFDFKKNIFDYEKSTKALEDFDNIIKYNNVNIEVLKLYKKRVDDAQRNANECVDFATDKIRQIENLVGQNAIDLENKNYKYLTDSKKAYVDNLANCRLFIFKSQESLWDYNSIIWEKSKSTIFKKSDSIWSIVKNKKFFAINNITYEMLANELGFEKFENVSVSIFIVLLGILYTLSFVLNTFLKNKLKTRVNINKINNKENSSEIDSNNTSINAIFKSQILKHLFLITSSVALFIFLNEYVFDYKNLFWLAFSQVFLLGALLSVLTKTYLVAKEKNNKIDIKKSINIYKYSMIVYSLVALKYVLSPLSISELKLIENIYAINILYHLLIVILGSKLAFMVADLKWRKDKFKRLNPFVKINLAIVLVATLIIKCIGFENLSGYLFKGVTLTFIVMIIFSFVLRIANNIIEKLKTNSVEKNKITKYYLGVKDLDDIIEIKILQFLVAITIILFFISGLMYAWGISFKGISEFGSVLFEGFKILEVKLIPFNVFAALLIFCLINLTGRYISAFVTRMQKFDEQEDVQVALASIVSYASFGLAILLALMLAGVNFTGLLVITGALSVGIGIGLQNIVNNFVCGLIILLQKPVKPGDRVIVNSTEGFVKKVRILTTQIVTLTKEDLLIPNSQLIDSSVINLTFRDKLWRLNCKVGVAYGSDIELVKKILTDIAFNHPEVIKSKANEPKAYFVSFGDSSLDFNLWCVIQNVNNRFNVLNELNSAIDSEFRKHNITIPFPQRDVHLKKR